LAIAEKEEEGEVKELRTATERRKGEHGRYLRMWIERIF
jgi:hypothetical protein